MKSKTNPYEVIEVVMKKNMTLHEYEKLLQKLRKNGFKGWSCQGYQLGFYQGNKGQEKV